MFKTQRVPREPNPEAREWREAADFSSSADTVG